MKISSAAPRSSSSPSRRTERSGRSGNGRGPCASTVCCPRSGDGMARRKPDLADLESVIGHAFKDRAPLERALTHISALHGTPADGPHYQRLEFLGDRVLGLCVADMLYR